MSHTRLDLEAYKYAARTAKDEKPPPTASPKASSSAQKHEPNPAEPRRNAWRLRDDAIY